MARQTSENSWSDASLSPVASEMMQATETVQWMARVPMWVRGALPEPSRRRRYRPARRANTAENRLWKGRSRKPPPFSSAQRRFGAFASAKKVTGLLRIWK